MFGRGGLGRFGRMGAAGGGAGPRIQLSALTIPEDAEEDEVIGTASISGSYTGTPEWSLSGDDTDKVQINSSTGVYSVAGALDFETQPTLNVVFEVTGVDPAVPNKPDQRDGCGGVELRVCECRGRGHC